MKALLVLAVTFSLFSCSSKPSKEALERAREIRLTQLKVAMVQTESQLHAAEMRIADAKKMKTPTDREAEIAAGKRESEQYLQQKKALQAELSAVMRATETEGDE